MKRLLLAALLVLPLPLAAQNPAVAQRVRQQLVRVLRTQVGLTDAQLQKLQELNNRLEGQRRALTVEETRVRQALRDEVTIGDTTRSGAVSELIDRLLKVGRQRTDLVEAEQKELSQFMSPMQRAKYWGVQEVINRRVRQMMSEQGNADTDSLASPAPLRGGARKRP